MKTIIFCGPSIPRHEVLDILPHSTILPPVSQGDVYLATKDEPDVIGIIDGFFQQVPSVWHKEIIWALSKGIQVFGAASMGALRAAELHTFGMIGVGEVFQAYKDGALEDDDEVAILHGPSDLEYIACTDALVDIRRTMHAAQAEGVICPQLAADLISLAKSLHYSERTFARIVGDLAINPNVEKLNSWLKENRVPLKKLDAIAMCHAIQRLDPIPRSSTFPFETTLHWLRLTDRLDRHPHSR